MKPSRFRCFRLLLSASLVAVLGLAHLAPARGAPRQPPAPKARSDQRSPERTFVASLTTAPFPYDGKYADTATEFFDHVNPSSRERFHTNRYGQRFSERNHYRDASVLFHFSPGFDPRSPCLVVLFFHGNLSSAAEAFRDFRLAEQAERSGRNLILVVPQLARQAADSSPGKFFRAGAFKAFLEEAADTLESRFGKEHGTAFRQAPVLLTAFSGGYKSVAYILDRGGAIGRVKAVLLLDALFEDLDKFTTWLTHNRGRRALVLLAGSSCAKNGRIMTGFLRQHGLVVDRTWPERIDKGSIHVVDTATDHLRVPVDGPPNFPLASFLSRLAAR